MRLTPEELDAINGLLPPREHRHRLFVDLDAVPQQSWPTHRDTHLHVTIRERETGYPIRTARIYVGGEVEPLVTT